MIVGILLVIAGAWWASIRRARPDHRPRMLYLKVCRNGHGVDVHGEHGSWCERCSKDSA